MLLIALVYVVVACWLALYGFNALYLTLLSRRRRPRSEPQWPSDPDQLPRVTVQLPLYNEKHVAARLIDAVCVLDYPRDRLEIQVLDDSTDETARLVAHRVARWRRRGVAISHIRRTDRQGYKAGALAHGLASATGELIAIFDADFVPAPDWLKRCVAVLLAPGHEQVGLVQSRWTHLNRDYSPLTRAQALALDGHFAIEQDARSDEGLLLNFNGTAGLWRRACIEAAGGWSSQTLCEDLDLSYRAQLCGWRIHYENGVEAPAELPAQIVAYKRQQFRWAKGSLQVARQLATTLLRADLTLWRKVQGLIHLTGYMLHPLLLLQLLLTLPLLLFGWPTSFASYRAILGLLMVAGLGAPLLYSVAQLRLYGRAGLQQLRWLPLLVLLGTGVAVSNSRAAVEAMLGIGSGEFARTPKFGLEGRAGDWRTSSYLLAWDWLIAAEAALSLYALLCALLALDAGQASAIPFLLLYAAAFSYVAAATLLERWGLRRARRAAMLGL